MLDLETDGYFYSPPRKPRRVFLIVSAGENEYNGVYIPVQNPVQKFTFKRTADVEPGSESNGQEFPIEIVIIKDTWFFKGSLKVDSAPDGPDRVVTATLRMYKNEVEEQREVTYYYVSPDRDPQERKA